MKKLIIVGLLGVMGWMVPSRAAAQLSIHVNIGSQPLWGPVGYDYVDNYYLPDIECYYNVPRRQFVYLDDSRWIYSSSLPSRYSGYDLYGGYKVVVNSRDPYRNFNEDRVRYARYRSVRSQQMIRYSRDSRYYVVKGHPYGGGRQVVYRNYDRNDRDWGRTDNRPGRRENNWGGRGNDHRNEGRNDNHGDRHRGGDRGRGRN